MGSRNNLIGKNPSTELVELYSNELQVNTNTPPTFLLHASDDGAVPVENSLVFYKALVKNNVPSEMHIYPEGGHGFSLAFNKNQLANWPGLLIEWMKNLD